MIQFAIDSQGSPKSLAAICRGVGLSRTYWHDLENETVKGALSVENLRKIEKVLDVNFGIRFTHQEGENAWPTV